MVITLPPELEASLILHTNDLDITPEALALNYLRRRLLPEDPANDPPETQEQRFRRLADDVHFDRKARPASLGEGLMILTLDPVLQAAAKDYAQRLGVPPEALVLAVLRERYLESEPRDEWERALRDQARPYGANLPDEAFSSEGLYD